MHKWTWLPWFFEQKEILIDVLITYNVFGNKVIQNNTQNIYGDKTMENSLMQIICRMC